MEGQEQNKSEEATPFKLKRAREKGQVARGMDLGFVGSLLAMAAFAILFGQQFIANLGELMRGSLTTGIATADSPGQVMATVRAVYLQAAEPLLVLGATIVVVLLVLEVLQLRGVAFSAEPLKPDFSRLNPAKGLKRLFSMRMLKETLKNIFKMAIYVTVAWLLIDGAIDRYAPTIAGAESTAAAMNAAGRRLLFAFFGVALVFMVIDQIIVRREFAKQMRMSRRELTRETKDREGDPRQKQKRLSLHEELTQQTQGLGKLAGADLMITNPEHFAVALRYDPATMDAPLVMARGRNHFAQLMKRKARLLALPVVADPPLARSLYAAYRPDRPITTDHYQDVARHYIALRRAAPIVENQDQTDV